jgi:hypothetical protein
VYSRDINDQILEFGVSGKLIMNVLVMYDRQTDSLWSQLLGQAVEGKLHGEELEYLPSWQTTWEDWKTRHPDTLALVKGYQGLRDPYFGYYSSGQAGVIGEATKDGRLPTKEFVIGVSIDDEAVAYAFSTLNDEPIVNDVVANIPVLVTFDADNASGVVFERSVDGKTLTFNQQVDFRIVDDETGTLWDGLTGTALEGELSGRQLQRVKSTLSFWFGWKDFYPETRVYDEGPD